VELLARISAAGWAGAYDPKPAVYHDHGRKNGWDEWRIMRSYERGRGGYYAKQKDADELLIELVERVEKAVMEDSCLRMRIRC
jgi:hypothetical protein